MRTSGPDHASSPLDRLRTYDIHPLTALSFLTPCAFRGSGTIVLMPEELLSFELRPLGSDAWSVEWLRDGYRYGAGVRAVLGRVLIGLVLRLG